MEGLILDKPSRFSPHPNQRFVRGPRGFAQLHDSIPARWTAAHEDEGALILVFESGYRSHEVCIDLMARQTGNTVRTRDC